MRRVRGIGLFCIALLVALCGCKAQKAESSSLQVANPIHLSSHEEILALDQVDLPIPQGSVDGSWVRIQGSQDEAVLDQVTFVYDAIPYCYRAIGNNAVLDVSGMYYNWTQERTVDGIRMQLADAGQGIALWFREGVSYCLSMSEKASFENLESMVRLLIRL